MNAFSIIFLIALALYFTFKWWLLQRQMSNVLHHRGQVPEAFKTLLTIGAHQQAADYTLAKCKLNRLILIWDTLILLVLTTMGGLGYLDTWWAGFNMDPLLSGIGIIASVALVFFITELPFTIYRTFKLEAAFGFNRTSVNTFIIDKIKGVFLLAVIGLPLCWLVLWIMRSSGSLWWLYVWLVITSFSIIMLWAVPVIIMPLFNKFSPLEEEPTKTRINALLADCGFKSNGIYVMDGSKRSAHGNAFFTGIGSSKRIVFFDTLLKQLNISEIEAVLAHELGHFRRHHVKKSFVEHMLYSLAGFALLGWLFYQPWFFQSMSIATNNPHPIALVLFLMVVPIFTFLLDPIFSYISRQREFEADAYAAEKRDAHDLVSALVKLYKENAATTTPDPLYSLIYDSHPPALIRIEQLKSHAKAAT